MALLTIRKNVAVIVSILRKSSRKEFRNYRQLNKP